MKVIGQIALGLVGAAVVSAVAVVSALSIWAANELGDPRWLGFLYQVVLWTVFSFVAVTVVIIPVAFIVEKLLLETKRKYLVYWLVCVAINIVIYVEFGFHHGSTVSQMLLLGLLPGVLGGGTFVQIQRLTTASSGTLRASRRERRWYTWVSSTPTSSKSSTTVWASRACTSGSAQEESSTSCTPRSTPAACSWGSTRSWAPSIWAPGWRRAGTPPPIC